MDKNEILAEVHKKMFRPNKSQIALIRVGDLIQILKSLVSEDESKFKDATDLESIAPKLQKEITKRHAHEFRNNKVQWEMNPDGGRDYSIGAFLTWLDKEE